MKTVFTLPEHYTRIYRINMKQKKFALWLNLAAAVGYIALMLLGMLFHPISLLFDMSDGLGMYALRFGVLLVGYFVYIILHEAIHGIVIRLYSGKWGSFGFTGTSSSFGSSFGSFNSDPFGSFGSFGSFGGGDFTVFDLPEVHIHIVEHVRCFVTADALR